MIHTETLIVQHYNKAPICQAFRQDQTISLQSPAERTEQAKRCTYEIHKLQKHLTTAQNRTRDSTDQLQQILYNLKKLEKLPINLSVARLSSWILFDSQKLTSRSLLTSKRPGISKVSSSLSIPKELKEFWYPVEFSSRLDCKTLVPLELFGDFWVLWRDQVGRPACLRDQCAHRACPLS